MCAIARGSLRLTRAHAIGVAGLEYLLPAVQRIARNAYAFNQHNEEPVQQSKVHMHMHENNINDNELEHSLVELKESHFPVNVTYICMHIAIIHGRAASLGQLVQLWNMPFAADRLHCVLPTAKL